MRLNLSAITTIFWSPTRIQTLTSRFVLWYANSLHHRGILSAWLDSNQRWIIGFADQWFRPLAHRRNLYWLFVVLIKLCSPLFLLIRKRPLDPTSDWLCYCEQQTLRNWKLIPFSKSVLLRYQNSNLDYWNQNPRCWPITPYLNIQADREGFEPSEEFTSVVLETTALNHSATDLIIRTHMSIYPTSIKFFLWLK